MSGEAPTGLFCPAVNYKKKQIYQAPIKERVKNSNLYLLISNL